jgi:hypothetical protein
LQLPQSSELCLEYLDSNQTVEVASSHRRDLLSESKGVLSQNLLTFAEEQIPSIRVEMTFVGGALRYQRGQVMSAK